ncbi:tRNA-specific 2-thiouridylase MnmA [Striga asiatica]|uniref:tRNA-specific 2-thiouridylase MnmA n=1 Tax=Striga asiatica TaxID=4170 RepID=A0A5A7R393_STRAF|nr:tRNA-specific 2-thiouridylase MnmA [Striga asiatica]
MDIFFLPDRPSTSAHRRRHFAHNTQPPSGRAAVRRFITSSSSADTTPRLRPPPACRLVSVSRLDASTLSTTVRHRIATPSSTAASLLFRQPSCRLTAASLRFRQSSAACRLTAALLRFRQPSVAVLPRLRQLLPLFPSS